MINYSERSGVIPSQKPKGKAKANPDEWDWTTQRNKVVNIFRKLIELDIKRIIVSGSERATLVR
jgi:hypothetical protein